MTSTFFVLSSICCSTQTDLSPAMLWIRRLKLEVKDLGIFVFVLLGKAFALLCREVLRSAVQLRAGSKPRYLLMVWRTEDSREEGRPFFFWISSIWRSCRVLSENNSCIGRSNLCQTLRNCPWFILASVRAPHLSLAKSLEKKVHSLLGRFAGGEF